MPLMGSYSSNFKGLSKVMIFIDGGYLRKKISEKSDGKINYQKLAEILTAHTQRAGSKSHLIRAYYYDAMPSLKHLEKSTFPEPDQSQIFDEQGRIGVKQQKLVEEIRMVELFDVRLGELVWSGIGKYRQKGVDSLVAIDMITKAYEGQYDEAVLVAGDSDFIEIVKAVKNIGPRVTGAYFESNVRDELLFEFDKRFPLRIDELEKNNIIQY